MGLFAVARLAARHGVKVRLRAASPQGLSALVWLPGSLIGREAARHVGAWPRQPARQAAAAQLSVGGRRVPGRHSVGPRAVGQQDDGSDGYQASGAVMATAPAAAPSNWFRAQRPSGASARGAVTDEVIASGSSTGTSTGTGIGSPGNAESAPRSAWADHVPTTETVSARVRGDQTVAGLPSRIPGANLFSGSAASAASEAWGPDETPVVTPRKPSRGTEEAPQAPPRSLPRRSPQQARNRLSGFQLGSRQAEGRTSSAGEGG